MGMTATATDRREALNHVRLSESDQRLLFLDARSNTEFSPTPVPLDAIRDAYDLIKWAPTANNANPARIVVANSEKARAQVMASASESNRPKLTRAPLILVIARDDRYHEFIPVTAPGSEASIERLEARPERRRASAHDGTLMQSANVILGLRAVGLAVRPYGGFDASLLDETLLAEQGWHAEMLLGVGYPPDGDDGAGPRKGRLSWEQASAIV